MYSYEIRTRSETSEIQPAAVSYTSFINFKQKEKQAMKKSKLYLTMLFMFAALIFTNSVYSQSGWVLKSTGTNINSVYFISPSLGWMVGDSGLAYASYDGGMNWSGLESNTKEKLTSVFFKTETTGWAAGTNGTIIKTTDGGDNWTVLSTGVSWTISSVHFPTLDSGYAVGTNLLKTTNGGTTWTDLGSFTGNCVFFTSANTGFFTDDSHIYKTTNGGIYWSTFIFSGHKSIFFINPSTGWAPSGSTKYTTNAGANWSSQATGSGFSTLYGIHFSDVNSGWSVGSVGFSGGNSEIRRTTNSGTNWTGQSSGTTNTLRSVSTLSSSSAIITGEKGTVLSTSNGGTNWISRLNVFSYPSDNLYYLSSVFFADNYTGWTGGYLGIVNKTTNGGDTWSSILSTSYNDIYSMHFLDKDTGWICGAGGMIQRTNNGGVSWTSQSLPLSDKIYDINIGKFPLTGFFGLHKIGWCTGSNGLIYKTTDGGGTWTGQLPPASINFYSVVPFSENDAVICGDSGRIYKTTNGGTSWSEKVSGIVNGALRSLAFADENYGICVGDSATVLYTTNKGDTWIPDLSGPRSLTSKNLYHVSARMEVTAVYTAVGDDGIILKTEDEGGSWIKQSSGVKTRLNGISSPSDGVCIVAGTRGTILRTSDGGALPVELTSFNYSVSGRDVILNWQTSSEYNNSGFEIERSVQNESEHDIWITAGFVDGSGTATVPQNYTFTDRNLNTGKYKYRLKQTDFNGNFEYFSLSSEVNIGSPDKFILHQNYPNPFNPVTKIDFELHSSGIMSMVVYDIMGKEVKTLLNEKREAGVYSIVFDGNGLSSGIYFYTLTSGSISMTKKFILLK